MIRILLVILTLSLAIALIGCGGSSSNTSLITIRSFEFDPNTLSKPLGTTISWVNGDNASHSVVSGTLGPGAFSRTFDEGVNDAGFSTPALTVTLGDKVSFQNLSITVRQIEVKDQNLNDVFLSPVLVQNETAVWQTVNAGVFTVRDGLHTSIQAVITVVGIPHPDGLFNSGILNPGQRFQFKPTSVGTVNFFCGVHNIEEGSVNITQ